MAKISFNNQDISFYNEIKYKVENYFKENNIKSTGNFKLYSKALILVPAAIGIYLSLLLLNLNTLIALSLSALLGFTLASIGFNVMHDACHGSYSSKKWINNLMGLSLNCLGGNAFIWKMKHNEIHHTFTNVDGIDDDIAKLPIIRQCESQKRMKLHKYQHFYSVIVYALSSFLWVFLMDFAKYFSKKVYTTPIRSIDKKEHFIFWLSKALYAIFYIAIPIYFVGALPWFCGFMAMHAAKGLTLAIVFQLAHVVEQTHFENATTVNKKIDYEWAIHQVRTTANFATNNKIVSWFVGGLNFQIEHHLFPRISHVHYPAISSLVEESCKKKGVEYVNYPTMTSAVISHFRFMKYLGKA
jgi:linoleoyl-CoA desaturase